MEIILQLKVTMIQSTPENFALGILVVTRGLTPRPWSMYIYVFQKLFGFWNFYSTSF